MHFDSHKTHYSTTTTKKQLTTTEPDCT